MYTSILLSSFAALTSAASISALDYCATTTVKGYCETLSYTDLTTTTPDAPSTAECQDTCRGLFTDAGDWGVDLVGKPSTYRQTLLGYPCAFAMGPAPGETQGNFLLDNQDIGDIIGEVSRRFGPLHSGKVAAEGLVRCQGFVAKWYIN